MHTCVFEKVIYNFLLQDDILAETVRVRELRPGWSGNTEAKMGWLGNRNSCSQTPGPGQRRQSQLGQARYIVCQEELKSRSQLIKVKQEISSWSGKIIPKQQTKWVEIKGNRQLQNSRWIGAFLVNLTFIPPPSVCKRPLLGFRNTYIVYYIQVVQNR